MRQELTNRAERIAARLDALFSPQVLEVVDESHLHAGHAGASPLGETHFRVEMTALSLAAFNRVDRHRAIYTALKDEFDSGLHALALDIKVS